MTYPNPASRCSITIAKMTVAIVFYIRPQRCVATAAWLMSVVMGEGEVG
jgi:hypothetical protein